MHKRGALDNMELIGSASSISNVALRGTLLSSKRLNLVLASLGTMREPTKAILGPTSLEYPSITMKGASSLLIDKVCISPSVDSLDRWVSTCRMGP